MSHTGVPMDGALMTGACWVTIVQRYSAFNFGDYRKASRTASMHGSKRYHAVKILTISLCSFEPNCDYFDSKTKVFFSNLFFNMEKG